MLSRQSGRTKKSEKVRIDRHEKVDFINWIETRIKINEIK